MKKSFLLYFSLTVFFVLVVSHILEAGTITPPPPQSVPLDPVSWILLASGGAIGAKKYYDYKKSKSTEE